MKKRLLHILALMMALVVLFVSMGWDIKFHYCTIDHELTGGFSQANCEHCAGHHHDHQEDHHVSSVSNVTQFNAKCCCDDFDELIHFSDNYTFSTEKPILVSLPFIMITSVVEKEDHTVEMVLRHFTKEKIPHLITGRLKTIFFSNLKLFPLPNLSC